MLTSFFKKSKPINFLIVAIGAILFYCIFNFTGRTDSLGWMLTLKKIGLLLVFLILLFFINFILVKDKSEGRHTYVLYLFALFCISSPSILTDNIPLIAGVFTVFGLRRTMGLQTGKHVSRKIFDAFFCFAMASLFFPPALFLLILPIFGVLYYSPEDYKIWGIALPALVSVFILKTTFSLITTDTFFNPLSHYALYLLDFQTFSRPETLWPLALIVLFTLWALFDTLSDTIKMMHNKRKAKYILVVALLVGTVVVLFSGKPIQDPSGALLFLYIPAALIGGRYFEKHKRKRLKEILLIALSIICICFAIIFKLSLA